MKLYKLPCIRCSEEDCLAVQVCDMESFTCSSCGEEFTLDDVRAALNPWTEYINDFEGMERGGSNV